MEVVGGEGAVHGERQRGRSVGGGGLLDRGGARRPIWRKSWGYVVY